MPPSDLYLVRHAQSEWNAAGRWQGQADPPLSELGLRQARELAVRFPDAPVERLLSSDLQRALATAAPLAERFGVDVEIDPSLRELDVGSWQGRTRAEIEAAEPGAMSRYYEGSPGWTGGETFDDHELRVAGVAQRIASLDAEGAAVVVTHGGTLRAIVRTLLEIPHAQRWRISGPGHVTLTHLTASPNGWRLVTFNGSVDLERA